MNLPIRTHPATATMTARIPFGTAAAAATDDDGVASSLQAWDAEGGADGACPPAGATTTPASLTAQQHRLLDRLGVALVHEWSHLPIPLQRAIYRRAVRGALNAEPRALAPPMDRFLDTLQQRHAQARRTLRGVASR